MFVLLLFGITALNFFLALLLFSKGLKNITNFLFALFVLGAAIWPFAIGLFLLSETIFSAYLWDKIIYVSGTIVPVSFIFFANLFTQKRWPKPIISFLYVILPVCLTFLLFFSDLFIKNIDLTTGNKSVQLGVAYTLWVIYFCSYMATGAFQLFARYRKSAGLEKLQLSYILLALFFPVVGALPFNIFLPLFGNYNLIYIGPIFLTIMVAVISYAIIRHRLMDIRFVAARAVAYSLLLIIISGFYVGATFVLSSMLLGITAGVNQMIIYTGLTVFVALSFDRLKVLVEKLTDRIFFKGRYDFQNLLSILGKIMAEKIELAELSNQFLQTLISQMRISKGILIVLGRGINSIYETITVGYPEKIDLTFEKISNFFAFSQTIIFDELEENRLKQILRELNVGMLRVLRAENQIVGVLILSEKSSGEAYSDQDLKVVEILAPEIAVAIQNSLSYDKIKKFNVVLSEEIRKATADLQEANRRLKALDHLKDDFVSVASHELRTPMAAIRSYAWMALHRSDVPLSKTLEKYLARILLSTERLINLVDDMLNVSRIESGRMEVHPEPVDLIPLIKDIIDEVYYSKSEEKNIQFVISDKPVPKVLADPERLREVFLNLVGNSLKFTPQGGKIAFDFFISGSVVETSVKDSGVGISPTDIPKLFHKFERLDTNYTAAATSGGTGLGLYISKHLIELMHGRIWVSSEGLNKGTTFTVSLPAA